MPGRGIGLVEAFQQLLPRSVRELFTLITQLGDAWFLFGAVALLYWFGDRRRAAFALAAILGSLSLTLALKGLFALPRPPAAMRLGYATGYGFPSGHAIGSTVAWGAFALVFERGRHHVRAAVAAVAVGLVAASRVIIGVHYGVDVLVGVLVGAGFLAALVALADWNPEYGFAVAAALAVAALVTYGIEPDTVATVGGVLGAGATWAWFETVPRKPVSPAAAVAGLAGLGVLGYAGNALGLPLFAVFALNAVVPAALLAFPLAVERAKRATSASPT
ncbi:acid phosphatase [Halobacteriales archaeon QS_1_67_19]|nr:MAG: acid phosphatase [Halobacteriales archaeon QS_1_67_19]